MLSSKELLRSIGITKPVFLRLLEIVKEAEVKKKKFGGRRKTKVNIGLRLRSAPYSANKPISGTEWKDERRRSP